MGGSFEYQVIEDFGDRVFVRLAALDGNLAVFGHLVYAVEHEVLTYRHSLVEEDRDSAPPAQLQVPQLVDDLVMEALIFFGLDYRTNDRL
jgi:hypothetical protein